MVRWDLDDIEIAVAIILDRMAGVGERSTPILAHKVMCYATGQGNQVDGLCVALPYVEYQTAQGKTVLSPFLLYLTFTITADKFELQYGTKKFTFSTNDLAVEVERYKQRQR